MADTLESLEIEVKHSASGAASELNSITTALSKLSAALTRTLPKLQKLAETMSKVSGSNFTINDIHDSTIQNITQKTAKAAEAKNNGPLSSDLQDKIAQAGKLEVAIHKAAKAEEDMESAFSKGNEDSAWNARERAINATAAAQRELAKSVPKVTNPLSDEMQEAISSASKVDILQAKLAGLHEAMQGAFETGDTEKAYAYRAQILQTEEALQRAKSAAEGASKGVKELSKEAAKSKKPLETIISSFKRIAFYRIIRSVLKNIGQAFNEGLQKAYLFSSGVIGEGNRFAAAMDRMKSSGNAMTGQLGSAFISLLAAIEPILTRIIDLITRVIDAISQLFAAFTGRTYLKASRTAAKFSDAMSKGAGAAKEWKNQLLGFDEINRLNEPSGGGGGGSSPLDGFKFEDTPLSDWAKKIHDGLAAIELAAGAFALAMGLILTLTGTNIPLGLALMALGVTSIVSALQMDWSTVPVGIAKALSEIMGVAGGALLGIGLILALTGANIPLGIGLIAAGATLITGAVAISWKAIPNNIRNVLSLILSIAGGMMLAIGLVLLFATPVFSPLGLALVAAGVASLAGSAALNWDWVKQKVSKVLSVILSVLAGAIAAVGAILCLSGAGAPVGIAILYAAYRASYGAYSLDANAVTSAVKSACDRVWSTISSLFQGIYNWFQSAHAWIQNLLDGFSLVRSANQRAAQSQADGSIYLGGFASGGYPDEGQLFIAREAGPEMVGTIGGRTAVANNDQIVEGIRQGVFEAVSAAMANNGTSEPVVKVYLDSREIRTGQQRLNRAMGV